MRTYLAGFRQARSFIAGTLIGLSIVLLVLAVMGASTLHWQILLVLSSPAIFAAGITLQTVVTAKSVDSIAVELGWKPVREATSLDVLHRPRSQDVFSRARNRATDASRGDAVLPNQQHAEARHNARPDSTTRPADAPCNDRRGKALWDTGLAPEHCGGRRRLRHRTPATS